VQFWTTDRRGAVEVATFSNPPHSYLNKPVIDELEQLVVQWRDPSIREVVIQSRAEDAGFFAQYSVEELYGLASDPATSRYSGAIVRGYNQRPPGFSREARGAALWRYPRYTVLPGRSTDEGTHHDQ
jgi:enoyl-CoA hydratase/carnithine racemase